MTEDLFQLEGEAEEVAVGASFAPSGWIGPMQATYVYGVGYVDFDLPQIALEHQTGEMDTVLGEAGDEGVPFGVLLEKEGKFYDVVRESSGGKWKFFYQDRSRANVLCQILDKERPLHNAKEQQFPHRPDQIWRIECRVADTLTLTDEGKSKFENDVMGWEVLVKAPTKSSKEWHLFHGMALPSFVTAYANMRGWENAGFSVEELLRPDDDLTFTDDLQLQLIGNTDQGFDASRFWSRRKLLWQSLGEDNPKASSPIGGKRNVTTSEKLSQALTTALSTWGKPVYCRVIQVRDPRVDASYPSASGIVRPRVALITDIYKNQAAAQAAATKERESWQDNGASEPAPTPGPATTEPGDDGVFVPEAWIEMPDDWTQQVEGGGDVEVGLREKYGGKPKPVMLKALKRDTAWLADSLMVTPEDVMKALA
jgi:hypothetical protein